MRSATAPQNNNRSVAINRRGASVLIVDLNNFASFPTLAVGIIVASLRNAAYDVRLISPLAHDVPASERERPEHHLDHLKRLVRLPYAFARTPIALLRSWFRRWTQRPHPRAISETAKALDAGADAILLSAYLHHYATVVEIGRLASARGVPLLLGGPMFNVDGTADAWRDIPGLSAIVGAEVDLSIPEIVAAAIQKDDLLRFPGVTLADGQRSGTAMPFRDLAASPVPDFTDYPWDRYRVHIIPLMAGRGCQWNRCTFCSDIVSASGRTFRSRGADSVLHEMREQARRHHTANFLFLDLKLNSNPHVFRDLVENVQASVRGAQWIGTVHVDKRQDNGLSRAELRRAAAAGMRRISFGLESGSQRMLDLMDKGSEVERNAEFIRDAFEAGISVRCTMFDGFPGETARDLELTAQFLERHAPYIDRIRHNGFTILSDTPMFKWATSAEGAASGLSVRRVDHRLAQAAYVYRKSPDRLYRAARARVLRAVFAINRQKIRTSAQQFDGLM